MFVTKDQECADGGARARGSLWWGGAALPDGRRQDQPKDSNKVVQAPKPAEKEAPASGNTSREDLPEGRQVEAEGADPAEAIKQSQEKVTVQFKVTSAQTFLISRSNVVGKSAGSSGEGCYLKDGDSFYVQLRPPVMDTIRRLGIEPDKHFKGKVVQVTGRLQSGPSPFEPSQFQIMVNDLTQIVVVGSRRATLDSQCKRRRGGRLECAVALYSATPPALRGVAGDAHCGPADHDGLSQRFGSQRPGRSSCWRLAMLPMTSSPPAPRLRPTRGRLLR